MQRRITPIVLVAGALVGAACSGGDDVDEAASRTTPTTTETVTTTEPAASTTPASTDGTDAAEFEPLPIAWEPFGDGVEVGTLDVPIDYDDPTGPTFELFLARYNALDQENKIGSLLINIGGPGFGSTDLATVAARVFDRPLLERFDIIGWDPRGTGESDPAIDCIDDYDEYFAEIDSTPDDPAERELVIQTAQRFAQACVDANPAIIEHVGTNNTARDIDTIRRALGEETISYFGFSYGSELGATWATLFPDTVRAAVLDGASDPQADATESSIQQLRGFEASLSTFLAQCSEDDACAFHNDGDAEAALEALLVTLDAEPVDSSDGRPPVNRDVATTAIVQAMYSESFWPALEQSLASAADGNGSGLLALYDSYYQRGPDGTYGNELEAFQAISCADTPERQTVDEVEAESALYTEVAPRLAPEGSIGFFCSFFPESIDPRADITGAGAGPIMVIGTTGDPATPFESTVRMSEVLEDGRLVIVEADQHTGYGVNRCVIEAVNDYLVDLSPPDSGLECR